VAMRTSKILLQMQLPPQIFAVSVIIFILFATRCIFNLISAVGYFGVYLDSDDVVDQLVIFLAYFCWEILTTILILVMFWRIPTTSIGGLSRRSRGGEIILPPSGNQGKFPKNPHSGSALGSRLFSERGLESEDETTAFLNKGSPSSYGNLPYTAHSFGKNTPYATTPINNENNNNSNSASSSNPNNTNK